jgi:hypothetical protein
MNRKPVIDYSLVADRLLFATHGDRCHYLGKSSREKAHWLKENAGRFLRIDDIERESAQLGPPVESENNVGTAPAGPNCEISSADVPKDGDHQAVALIDTLPGEYLPPYQPTSLPTPVKANSPNGSMQTELLSRAKAALSEAIRPTAGTTPLGPTRLKPGRSRGRRIKKQKPPAGIYKVGRKLSPQRMRVVIESLREHPFLCHAARKAGIHRKTLEYWLKCSKAGDDGYDIEWQGVMWRFHEHCQTAIEEAYDKVLEPALELAMGVVYKNDEFLLSLGYEGPEAYLRDKNGSPVIETVRKPNGKMLRFLLEWWRPEEWGKHRKIDVPRKGGVVIIGDIAKKSTNCSTASIKARKWKSGLRMIREA